MGKLKNSVQKIASRSLNLAMFESAITAGLLAMSIMTPFFNSIGLSNEEIAITQGIFTVVVLVLNVPAGWVADRFGRKWANVIGDIGCFIVLIGYSQVTNMLGAVICESLLGLMMALSQGVDNSLIRHFSYKIATGKSETAGARDKNAEELFKNKSAKLALWQFICTFVLVFLGGPIGAIDFRLAIFCSGITHLVGGIAGIFIVDDSEKLKSEQNPLKDMGRILKESAKNAPLRRRIFIHAIGREMTHGIIWVITPIFLSVGMPLTVVSGAWAINSLTCVLGSWLATKFAYKMSERKIFAIPLILMVISMGTMSISLNMFTIWFYFLMGIVQGWTSSTLLPMVQKHIKPSEQTSVVSIAKVAGQILYIPTVWIIGRVADIDLRYAPIATIAIFLPLGLIALKSLINETKNELK